MSARNSKRRIKFGRIAEFGLILTAFVTVLFVISFGVRVTRGVTRTADTPNHVVRLEILNGCRVAGIAGKVSHMLSQIKSPELEIKVISTGDFDLRKVTESFVISREKDRKPAELLAEALGLNPEDVIYRPLDNNHKQVSATLVLGEDFHQIKPMALASEE